MDLSDLRQAEGAAGEALALARRAEQLLAGSEQRDLSILAQLQLVKIHLAQKNFAAADERSRRSVSAPNRAWNIGSLSKPASRRHA